MAPLEGSCHGSAVTEGWLPQRDFAEGVPSSAAVYCHPSVPPCGGTPPLKGRLYLCTLVQTLAHVPVGAVHGGFCHGFLGILFHELGSLFHVQDGAGTGDAAAGAAHAFQ